MSNYISTQDLVKFYKLQPLRSLARGMVEWSVILAVICFTETYFSIPLYFIAILVIATRQHALLVLMHEGAHFRLSNSKILNDIYGDVFLAWPHLMSMRGYRRHHNKHHVKENLNTLDDPDWGRKQNADWAFPMKRIRFLKMIIFDLLGLNTMDYFKEAKDAKNNVLESNSDIWLLGARISFYVAVAVLITHFNLWLVIILYWLIPIFTFLKALLRIRSITDHFGLDHRHFLRKTRITHPSLLEKVIFYPASISLHTTHHLFPGIPYYNISAATKTLNMNSEFKSASVQSFGLREALKACLT